MGSKEGRKAGGSKSSSNNNSDNSRYGAADVAASAAAVVWACTGLPDEGKQTITAVHCQGRENGKLKQCVVHSRHTGANHALNFVCVCVCAFAAAAVYQCTTATTAAAQLPLYECGSVVRFRAVQISVAVKV